MSDWWIVVAMVFILVVPPVVGYAIASLIDLCETLWKWWRDGANDTD